MMAMTTRSSIRVKGRDFRMGAGRGWTAFWRGRRGRLLQGLPSSAVRKTLPRGSVSGEGRARNRQDAPSWLRPRQDNRVGTGSSEGCSAGSSSGPRAFLAAGGSPGMPPHFPLPRKGGGIGREWRYYSDAPAPPGGGRPKKSGFRCRGRGFPQGGRRLWRIPRLPGPAGPYCSRQCPPPGCRSGGRG